MDTLAKLLKIDEGDVDSLFLISIAILVGLTVGVNRCSLIEWRANPESHSMRIVASYTHFTRPMFLNCFANPSIHPLKALADTELELLLLHAPALFFRMRYKWAALKAVGEWLVGRLRVQHRNRALVN